MMSNEEESVWTPEEKLTGISLLVFPLYAYFAFEGCGKLYDFLNQPIDASAFILAYGTISLVGAVLIRLFIKSRLF